MPDTLQAVTGSLGRHFYLEHPGVPVPNAVSLMPGLDIRGDGGLVVAPPSVHKSGRLYTWDGIQGIASPILPSPGWLIELVFGKQSAGDKSRFALPMEIPEGTRNDTLHGYACSLRGTGGGLEVAEILDAVSAANRSRCKPPLDNPDLQSLVESACKHRKGNGGLYVVAPPHGGSGGSHK
jgi:hypothetical protein